LRRRGLDARLLAVERRSLRLDGGPLLGPAPRLRLGAQPLGPPRPPLGARPRPLAPPLTSPARLAFVTSPRRELPFARGLEADPQQGQQAARLVLGGHVLP